MNTKQLVIASIALLMLVLSACTPMVMSVEAAEPQSGSLDVSATTDEAYAHIGAPYGSTYGTNAGQSNKSQSDQVKNNKKILEFDVAEDMNRFIFDQDIAYEDGLPADGSSFITRGYLYPVGTLDGTNGVNPDGSPEFPDEVIGEWICQGYMINDAGHATGGVWVFSTQFFQIGDEPGAETIVTTGYELADVDVPIARAITGGSGEFSAVRGESTQTLLGLNASEGVNLRVSVNMEK